jgi:hypothetical protein
VTSGNNLGNNLRCNKSEELGEGPQHAESTLACSGSPVHAHFFRLDTGEFFRNHPWRRKTLFNMYAFADNKSTKDSLRPPQLTLDNCTFKYFLGGYESLIHVETDNLWEASKMEPRYEHTAVSSTKML